MRQYSETLRIWELFPEYFRGRWAVLHRLARELDRPEIEPPPVKYSHAPRVPPLKATEGNPLETR